MIQELTIDSPGYPDRLRGVADAPERLFYLGNANLNHRRVVSIIGTRHMTLYGQDLIRKFIRELKAKTDALIISGLAYGVDLCAHKEALANGLDTVGSVAHGLDTIYPAEHKKIAREMVERGGVLSAYPEGTVMHRAFFLERNKIVAAMSDAVICVESAVNGGGMHTMRDALNYGRRCFAFPGNVGNKYSEGCNLLIQRGEAEIITGVDDFLKAMGWREENEVKVEQGELEIWPELTEEEERIVEALRKDNDMAVNKLSTILGIPVYQLYGPLLELELKGLIKSIAGDSYHLML